MKQKIYSFLEHPKGVWAISFQIFIIFLILASVGIVFVEFTYPYI